MPEETQNTNIEKTELTLDAKIEAILFYKAEPVKISELAKMFEVEKSEIEKALSYLKSNLSGRGISLTEKEDSVVLVTSNEMSELITEMKKEELTKELSKAAMETLSIIIYRGPVKRSEIDYIRGVNSQFTLRALLIRGLIEKVTNPKDERTYLYRPSFDLLNLLGINNIQEIPEFESVNSDVDSFIKSEEDEN